MIKQILFTFKYFNYLLKKKKKKVKIIMHFLYGKYSLNINYSIEKKGFIFKLQNKF